MKLRLTPGQSRLAAISLALLVFAVVALGVVFPVWRIYHANAEEIETSQDRIERFSRIAAHQDALEKKARLLDERRAANRRTLSAQSTSLAAAELQERVKAVVEQTGSRLTSTRVLTPAEEGSFYRVAVNVRMRVSVEALQEVLHGLEGALPYMTVDNVTVLARRARRNRRNTAAGPQTLDVRFDLSALMPRGTA